MNNIIQIVPIEFLLIVHAFAVNMATIVCDVRCIGVGPIPLLQEPKKPRSQLGQDGKYSWFDFKRNLLTEPISVIALRNGTVGLLFRWRCLLVLVMLYQCSGEVYLFVALYYEHVIQSVSVLDRWVQLVF